MSVAERARADAATPRRSPRLARRRPTRAVAPVIEEFAGASLQSQVLAQSLRRTVKPLLKTWSRYPTLPWPAGLIDLAFQPVGPAPGHDRTRVRLPHSFAEFVRPTGDPGATQDDTPRAILYLHGGGFLCCGVNTHRQMVARIANRSHADTLSVAYRMIPEAPLRGAVADGVDGYRWLLDQGYEPGRIAIVGDSAGGFLVFMVTLEALAEGLPAPAVDVAMSPLTDLDPARKLAHPNAKACPVFPDSALRALSVLIDRVDTHAGSIPCDSPVDADLRGMPPALIQVGSDEILYPDALLMAERLGAAGVPSTVQVFERQVHVFQAAAGFVPEGRRALSELGRVVREATA
ncbi:alpha/beta hydrolase [Rhodococcus rhodnii]|nr:alpha/beta hydrolase [Rhodococcus rhodnii]TXG92827.1 alpha/beta hydrolase [Rhodococcus rhodnii]